MHHSPLPRLSVSETHGTVAPPRRQLLPPKASRGPFAHAAAHAPDRDLLGCTPHLPKSLTPDGATRRRYPRYPCRVNGPKPPIPSRSLDSRAAVMTRDAVCSGSCCGCSHLELSSRDGGVLRLPEFESCVPS